MTNKLITSGLIASLVLATAGTAASSSYSPVATLNDDDKQQESASKFF